MVMKTLSALLLLSFTLLAQFGCSWGWNGYVEVDVKIFLQGPYNAGVMNTTLLNIGYIPTEQPYDVAPWNYPGEEAVDDIPANTVDWVLIELREDSTKTTTRKAGFLLSNGKIVDLDGINPVKIKISPNKYYIVIYHRNHIPIMSAERIVLKRHSALYDFTIEQTQAYGTDPLHEFEDGNLAIFAGDADKDYDVDSNDFSAINANLNAFGYYQEDCNMSGIVTNSDKYISNTGQSTQIPN